MRSRNVSIVVALFLLAAVLRGQAMVLHVDVTAMPGGNGSLAQPFWRIQDALIAAANGDTVLVRPGVYFENVNFLGKAVAVVGAQGAGQTVIDANFSGICVAFVSGEGRSSILRGFTIRHGSAPIGAGILCQFSGPTIRECTIHLNAAAQNGGGIGVLTGGPFVTTSSIKDNSAGLLGGGLSCDAASIVEIEDTLFRSNTAMLGAGVANDLGFVRVARCTFHLGQAAQDGGGIYTFNGTAQVLDSVFDSNSAANGGGLFDFGSAATINNSLFRGNGATSSGGGIASVQTATQLTNCFIVGNTAGAGGGAFDSASSLEVRNSTVTQNQASIGGGLGFFSSVAPRIWNSIVRGNGPTDIGRNAGANLVTAFSNIGGGSPGAGNFDLDPLFKDVANGDFHLTLASPCRNAGSAALYALLPTDFDRQPRAGDTQVDIGADEFYPILMSSGDDLSLEVLVDGAGLGVTPQVAPPQSIVTTLLWSPNGNFSGLTPLLAGQFYVNGQPPSSPPGFPYVHLDPVTAGVIFDGASAGLFGPIVLSSFPISLNFQTPVGLGGLTFRTQLVCLTAAAQNGIFAITDARELVF